jgi:hypothetical protein
MHDVIWTERDATGLGNMVGHALQPHTAKNGCGLLTLGVPMHNYPRSLLPSSTLATLYGSFIHLLTIILTSQASGLRLTPRFWYSAWQHQQQRQHHWQKGSKAPAGTLRQRTQHQQCTTSPSCSN